MGKVVINTCYGGFGLSEAALTRLKDLNPKVDYEGYWDIERHDPFLVQVVEELGEKAAGDYASLEVCNFKGNRYKITEYDGAESLDTPDDIEWTIIEGEMPHIGCKF